MNDSTVRNIVGSMIIACFVMPLSAATLPGERLENGDFESDPFLTGWTLTGDPTAHDPLGDGTQAVALHTSGQRVEQTFDRTENGEWTFEGLFAVTADTSDNAARTGMRIILNHEISGAQSAIHLRVQRVGPNTTASVQVQDADNAWNTIIGSAVEYSELSDNNDAILDPIVYRLVIRGYGYGTEDARYIVEVINADETVASSGDQTIWWGGGAPVDPDETGIKRVQVLGGQNETNLSVFDELSVRTIPEPGTMGLLGIGMILTLGRARR